MTDSAQPLLTSHSKLYNNALHQEIINLRIVRIAIGKKIKYGEWKGNTILGYSGSPFTVSRPGTSSFRPDGTEYKIDEVRLLAPCVPSKIVCLGLNYRSHAGEFNLDAPKVPIIFLKPLTSVIGPNDKIILPVRGRIDYECELAVVIGKKAKNVSSPKAMDYVLGYTCFNDVTNRTDQKNDGQWTRAKGYDTFAPIGPCIQTDINAGNLQVETYVNGELRQSGRTSDLIFSIPELIVFITGVMTLLPGDVIATGTPAGIGPIEGGDTVEIKVEKIGTLSNPVVARKGRHHTLQR